VPNDSLWLFGYGSLVWRPAFRFRRRHAASISGYVRRFWQGSADHRGVPERPGRVVTLLPAREEAGHEPQLEPDADRAHCWGTAYEIAAEDRGAILESLDHRERGGYTRLEIEMLIRTACEGSERVEGLVYVAGPTNSNYLGPASIAAIARQIATAAGPSGANPEYVFELARSLRSMGADDDHVFSVERAVAALLQEDAT